MIQSCPEASPVKWHQAHTTWFFETFVLRPFLLGLSSRLNENFRWLFNSYYNSLGDVIPEKKLRASFSRPSLDEVMAFRVHMLTARWSDFSRAQSTDEASRRIIMGLNHEQQHQELAHDRHQACVFHKSSLPIILGWSSPRKSNNFEIPRLHWHSFDGGLVEIGCPPEMRKILWISASITKPPRHAVYLRTIPDRESPCDLPRIFGIHFGQRLQTSRILAFCRLGKRQGRGLAGTALLATR